MYIKSVCSCCDKSPVDESFLHTRFSIAYDTNVILSHVYLLFKLALSGTQKNLRYLIFHYNDITQRKIISKKIYKNMAF